MDNSFYADFSMFFKISIIFAIFYFIVAFGNALEKARIKCPKGTEAIMDNDLSERPCYKIVHNKMSYFEASRACKISNGFIPGINNNLKDISITTTALILKQLYNEYYFWLGCHNLTSTLVCDDGTELGNYQNWDPHNDPSIGNCVVVSLTTGKWKMAACLDKFAFPCKYHSTSSDDPTPETSETEPPISAGPHRNHSLPVINITLDLSNLNFKFPDYSGLIVWIFGILIVIFGCLQCLCFQCFKCVENLHNPGGRRRYNYSNQAQEGRNRFGTFWSNPSSSSNSSSLYSPDPSEEAARLLEAQDEIRQRAFSTFSNRNWIPIINNNQQVQNSPPRSVIITIPPLPSPQASSIQSISPQITIHNGPSPQGTNIEELLALHGHYGNYPSFTRSEVSSILEQLSGNYIRREDRAWDRPPQYPLYYTSADEEIGVALCRNVPQLLPPPPPYSSEISNRHQIPSIPPTSPTMSSTNLHNNLSPQRTTVHPTRTVTSSTNVPTRNVDRDILSSVRALGVPVLPPTLETETFENRIRRNQNRRRTFEEENQRLLKKHV